MRILHIYKDYYPILGGIEGHIQTLAEAQVAAGHEVFVLVTDPGGQPRREVRNGVQIFRTYRLGTVASTPLTLGFLTMLPKLQPEITHLHFPYPIGEISNFLAGGRRPYVITYHSDVVRASQQKILRLYQPLLEQVLQRADRILITSQNYAASSPFLKPLAKKWELVPFGIDPLPFRDPVPLIPKGARLRLLFLGRHRYYKGLEQLLKALPDTQAELLVGGSGPMRAEWERLAAELNLGDRVRFLGDVAPEDLPGVYASTDVFVLPSILRAEAFGIVLLEAMAAGLPCITSELGTGTSYIVQDGISGIVTPPENPLALANAINRLDANPDLREAMGKSGKERLIREFTTDRMLARVETIYTSVLKERQALIQNGAVH